MTGHIIPYSKVFVTLTLTLDEAAALSAMANNLKHKDPSVQKVAAELGAVLEENLEKAAAYQARRAT